MEDVPVKEKKLPFGNLFLIAGLVSGSNHWRFYLLAITFVILVYLLAPVFTLVAPMYLVLLNKGFSAYQIDGDLILNSEAAGIDLNWILLGLFISFAITGAAFIFAVRRIHGKPLTSVLTGYERFRGKRLFFGFLVWSGLLVAGLIIELAAAPGELQWTGVTADAGSLLRFATGVLIMAFFFPFQTGFEEAFFRGYLMQGISQVSRNAIVPLIITSLLFAAAHMTNPEAGRYGMLQMMIYYTCFAMFLGAITLIDEGIELAWGIHLANNFLSSVIITTDHSTLKTHALFRTAEVDPQGELITWAVCASIAFVIFRYRYGWKNYRLLLK